MKACFSSRPHSAIAAACRHCTAGLLPPSFHLRLQPDLRWSVNAVYFARLTATTNNNKGDRMPLQYPLSALFRCLTKLAPCSLMLAMSAVNAQPFPDSPVVVDCDRACLTDIANRYLDGLVAHDAARIPWADAVKFTENNVPLAIGDGIWGTITGLGDYKLYVTDERNGEIGFFGQVMEPNFPSLMAMRLKVRQRKISEAEMVILRMVNEPKGIVWPDPILEDKPEFTEVLPPERRRPRERLISIADGYFDTLQLNDGTLYTEFAEDCDRVENGTKTTHNPAVDFTSVGALGCEEQFKQGNYRYDDRLRARRYPLVDEERGLVLAAAFIDHSGVLGEYTLTDGRVIKSPIRYPHSFYLLELFKIDDGKIKQIESVFVTVPYGMASPWLP